MNAAAHRARVAYWDALLLNRRGRAYFISKQAIELINSWPRHPGRRKN